MTDDGRTKLSQSTENLAQIISKNLVDLWNCLLEERSDLSIVFDTVAKRFDLQVTLFLLLIQILGKIIKMHCLE